MNSALEIDVKQSQSEKLLSQYEYKYFIGTYPIWHIKSISDTDNPFSFVINFRIDKEFGFGFEYIKSVSGNEISVTWKHYMPLISYEVKTQSDKFILELLLGAELTKAEWVMEDSNKNSSAFDWSGLYGCRIFYNVKNNFFIGMLGVLSKDWYMNYNSNELLSYSGMKIRPDFGIYYMFD